MSATLLLDDDSDSAAMSDALRAFARDAGQRAHDRGLAVRGSVVRVQNGQIVREWRDGSLAVLRPMAPGETVRPGLTLQKRR